MAVEAWTDPVSIFGNGQYEAGIEYSWSNNKTDRTFTLSISKIMCWCNYGYNFDGFFQVLVSYDQSTDDPVLNEGTSATYGSSLVIPGSGSDEYTGTLSTDVDLSVTVNYNDNGDPEHNLCVWIGCGHPNVEFINEGSYASHEASGWVLINVNNGTISPKYIDPWISITDPSWDDNYDSNEIYHRDRNANKNLTISYSDNNEKSSGDSNIKLQFYLNGNLVKDNDASESNMKSGKYTYSSSDIMKYAPFPTYDNKNSTVTALRYHTGLESEDKSSRKFRFLYTPVKSVTDLVMKSGNNTISGNIGDKKDITLSWSYPSGEYGIVSGYEIRLRNRDSNYKIVKTYRTTNTSYTVSSNDYKTLINYDFIVYPYYSSGNDTYSYGPSSITSSFISVYRLEKPTIQYPLQNNYIWYANKLYILFTLPYDNDYNNIGNTYSYRNIEVSINNTIYSFLSHKNKYSITTLNCHNSKVVFVLDNVSNASHSIKIRCQKNYGYNDYSSSTSKSWSDWSDISYIQTQSYNLFSVSRGDKIMTSHINDIITKAYNSYNKYLPSIEQRTISQYSIIHRSDYTNLYNILKSIYEIITGWGTYQNTNIKLKNFPSFNALIEEISANESTSVGHNYILIISKCIKFFSTQ